ncbi:MAG TPA: hypothetical protein VMD27_04250 [Candidatus Aquilonibacter sp.]|nr:hypothetical protein [Candidatus Aquilonibacter sp.]
MATKISSEKALADAANIDKVWGANPNITLGSDNDPDNPKVTYPDFQAATTKVSDLVGQIETTRNTLTKMVDDKDDAAGALSDLNTRALSAIRGIFGPNSAQYDQAGGVRTSERKKPVRTAKTSSAKTSN